MFRISGPGVYRRRNGEVIEIVADKNEIWIKRGSFCCYDRKKMAYFDRFYENGRVELTDASPFDLVQCVKLVVTPADHSPEVAAAEQNFAAAFSDVPASGKMETLSDRLGPRLRYHSEFVVDDSIRIEDAVQFVIQKCGIPAVAEALILSRNPKVAFLKLFGDAVSMTVKRDIHANAEVKITFL